MSISDMWSTITPDTGKGKKGGRRERDELQDGEYTIAVASFDYWNYADGTNETERYKWGLEVVDGLCKGKYVEKYQKATPIGLQILADDLMLLLGEMPPGEAVYDKETNRAGAIVSAVVGKKILMRQRTSANGYPNFYFNEVVDSDFDTINAPPTAGLTDADDIPF